MMQAKRLIYAQSHAMFPLCCLYSLRSEPLRSFVAQHSSQHECDDCYQFRRYRIRPNQVHDLEDDAKSRKVPSVRDRRNCARVRIGVPQEQALREVSYHWRTTGCSFQDGFSEAPSRRGESLPCPGRHRANIPGKSACR